MPAPLAFIRFVRLSFLAVDGMRLATGWGKRGFSGDDTVGDGLITSAVSSSVSASVWRALIAWTCNRLKFRSD